MGVAKREARRILEDNGYCLIHGIQKVFKEDVQKGKKKEKKSSDNNGFLVSGRKMRDQHSLPDLICLLCLAGERREEQKKLNQALETLGFRKRKRVPVFKYKYRRNSWGNLVKEKVKVGYEWKFQDEKDNEDEDDDN